MAPAAMDTLVVTGVHAMLHDDDAAAAFVNSGDSLMTWSCDETIRMDRFDVRHLLLDASDIRTAGRHKFTPDVSEEVLDEERYRDLQEGRHEDEQDVEDNAMDERPSTAKYATVPFDYGSSDRTEEKPVQAVKVDKDEPPFVPSFPVPEHLEPHLPPSQKIHHIMCGTAKFVRERGGQTEIILRVKQANNPNFGFLMPDHILHPYFRYLVDHPEISTEAIKPKEAPKSGNALVTKPAEGLRLLGEVYGDDDEDDDGSAPKLTVEVKTIKEPPPNLKSVIQKMVEFIARNGKAFEDVVKERDKNDERFQFLHPWHEYHPYYLSKLQIVDQMNLAKPQGNATAGNQQPARRKTRFDVPPSFLQAPSAKISPIVVGKTSATSSPAMVGKTSETNSPYSLMVRKTSEVTSPLVLSGGEEFMGVAQHEQPDMCYDAAYAAVIAATRGMQTGVHGSGVGTDEETGSDVDTAGKAGSNVGIPGKAGSDGESHEKAGPAGETDSHGKVESGTEKADKKAERLRKARMLLAQMDTGDQTEVSQKQQNGGRTESQKQQVDEPQNEDGESVRHRGRHREKKRKRHDYEDDDDRSRRHRRHDGDDDDGDGDDLHRSHRGHRSHREDDDGDDHHRSHKRYDADDVDDRHHSGRNRRRHDDEDDRHRVKEDDHHRRRRSRYDAGEAEHDHRARRSRRRSYRDLEDEDGDYRGGRKSHREENRRSREEESKKVMMFKDEDEDEKDESNPVVSEDIRAKVRQMLQSI